MQAVAVVEVDVAAQGGAQRVIAAEVLPVVHVGLHRLVPRLHVRVVGHAAWAIDALHQPGAGQGPLVVTGQELRRPPAFSSGTI